MAVNEQEAREALEIKFWYESEDENPDARSLGTLTNKMSEARIVLEKFAEHGALFAAASTILELGGGQGWVSCMVAREFPGKHITTTDISPAAVAGLPEWERILDVKLDGSLACRSYDIPVADESLDLVFAFASAHHFGAHRRTFAELARVLKPGGKALYLHEPACPDWIYKRAVKRVNTNRPVVREDLLRTHKIVELAKAAGLSVHVRHAPTTTYRGPVETVYYMVMQRVPLLRRLLPCTVDMVFTKPV